MVKVWQQTFIGKAVRKTIAGILSLGAIALLLSLQLSGCSHHSLKVEAARGSQIIDSQMGEPKTFNYALNDTYPNVFGLIYETLLAENATNSAITPALAESWQISPDRKTITFTLRPELKWSDGKPFTVDDIIFTFQDIYFNPDIPTPVRDAFKVGREGKLPTIRKLDDRRVEFTTPEPFAPMLLMAGGTPILPKHVLEASVREKQDGKPKFLSLWNTGSDPTQVVGNGPYRMTSYTLGQRVIFERNPYYWERDGQGKQKPFVERLVWKLVENQNTSLLQFRSGGPDVVEPIRPEDFALLKREEKRGKFTVYMGESRQIVTFMFFNLNQGKRNGKHLIDPIKLKWFTNVSFRQAIAHAIDRERMNTNLYRGLGVLVNSPIIPASPFHLSPTEGLKVYDYNIEKAKQLLLKAGFTYNDQKQLLDEAGNPVKFTLTTNASNLLRVSMIGQIKQDLAQIGIEVGLEAIDFNVMTDRLDNSMDFDAILMAFGAGPEPHSSSNLWSLEGRSHLFNQRSAPGQPSLEGQVTYDWEKEISDLYIKAAQEFDLKKRKELYGRTQILTQENLPFIYLVNARVMSAVRDRIKGINYPKNDSARGYAMWNLPDLHVED
ncbi:MAG: ABC transporter substrate-binding protein [Synechococcales bacterium]|nr:ABC transporter substrate-binding protein [Synechococcales bacterium]